MCYIVVAMAMGAFVILVAGKGKILDRGYRAAEKEYNKTTLHEHTLKEVHEMVDRVHKELVFTSVRLLIPAVMLGLGAFVLSRAYREKPRGAVMVLTCGMIALALVDLLAFAIPFNPGSPANTYFPRDVAAIGKLQSLPPARIAGTFRTMMPETSTAYGMCDLRGYDALGPVRYYRWWEHKNIGRLPENWYGYLLQLRNPEHPAWGLLNFGYVVSALNQPPPNPERFELVSRGADAAIYKSKIIRPRAWVAERAESGTLSQVLDRVSRMDFNPDEVALIDLEKDAPQVALPVNEKKQEWSRQTVEILPKDRPEHLRMKVSGGGGMLVLADTYFPGWEAKVITGDGKMVSEAIRPVYGVMRGVALPESSGPVMVEMEYRPRSWRVGSMMSMVALGVLVAGAAGLLVRWMVVRTARSQTRGR
jgi:hypothetical protein